MNYSMSNSRQILLLVAVALLVSPLSLFAQAFSIGTEGGLCVGAAVITGGDVGLAVWGDDPSTDETDGLIEDEAFVLRMWNAGSESDLTLSSVLEGSGLIYQTDGLLVLEAEADITIPVDFFLSGGCPNPFNSATRINFGLPEADEVSIKVYDIAGRFVASLVDGNAVAGRHSVVWDATGQSSGIYILWMKAGGYNAVQKVALIK